MTTRELSVRYKAGILQKGKAASGRVAHETGTDRRPGFEPPTSTRMRAPWIDASSWWTTASSICQQLSQLLAHPDRQITIATDGTAALEWLVEHPCSLVLTDLRLPGISGLDLIREIRERELAGDGHRDDRLSPRSNRPSRR